MADATGPRLEPSRAQILGHRRAVGALDRRLPAGPESLRHAGWAGLQDSMPRAASLSLHARVAGVQPTTWEDPSLVQVWGPRFSAYVIGAVDRAFFALGRLPDEGPGRDRAEDFAKRLDDFLQGRRMTYGEAGRALGMHPNSLRYAATTGTVLIRWEGARQPIVWTVPRPDVSPLDARLELARRYLHIFGPGTADGFSDWAGIKAPRATSTFAVLAGEMTPVRTPIGDAWILAADEASFRTGPRPPAAARLLPSGDAWFLLQGAERDLLVADADRRPLLWTPRVWPGAVLVDGEIVGTWRRADAEVTVEPWRRLSAAERTAIEAEAASFPLAGLSVPIRVRWVNSGSPA